MNKILNITNGDCAVDIMKQANIPGDFLPWRDVLHDGPVPGEISLDALSKIRAEFIIERGWGAPEDVINDFVERDKILKSITQYKKVILWFEHDLYDQLQILQILDWFHGYDLTNHVNLSIICTNKYLGMLSANDMKDMFRYEKIISNNQLDLANKAWAYFRSNTPEPWHDLLSMDTRALPFLRASIIRLLEEYPSCFNGLSRTAQQALSIISNGETKPGQVFSANQACEDPVFLGDWSFWAILNQLLTSNPPLLKLSKDNQFSFPIDPEQTLTITTEGEEVLSGKRNWLDFSILDHWLGGVHLTADNCWCWDADTQTIHKKSNI